ncbi:MAG TPA: hypothetical protein VET85_12340 [Stellaceae bacterium]|nr:hypothetical protein [Stellaceae bacterium]
MSFPLAAALIWLVGTLVVVGILGLCSLEGSAKRAARRAALLAREQQSPAMPGNMTVISAERSTNTARGRGWAT